MTSTPKHENSMGTKLSLTRAVNPGAGSVQMTAIGPSRGNTLLQRLTRAAKSIMELITHQTGQRKGCDTFPDNQYVLVVAPDDVSRKAYANSLSGRRKSLDQSFKSPLGQLFKSPLPSVQTPERETPHTLQAEVMTLRKKLAQIESEIECLTEQGFKETELQTHIKKLHEYNEIKDTGQMLLGRIADIEGVQTKDLYDRYTLGLED